MGVVLERLPTAGMIGILRADGGTSGNALESPFPDDGSMLDIIDSLRMDGEQRGSGGLGVAPAEATVSGSLDREVIQRVIRTQLGPVRRCYERAVAASPTLEGRIDVAFTIALDGSVHGAAIEHSTIASSTMEDCVLDAIRTWTFPRPADRVVRVRYPFRFLREQPVD
jgi:TonB family protein